MSKANQNKQRNLQIHYSAIMCYTDLSERRAFEMGAKWADSHPNWISVRDQEPPQDESILLYGHGWYEPVAGEAIKYKGGFYYTRDNGELITNKVTHWSHFPSTLDI